MEAHAARGRARCLSGARWLADQRAAAPAGQRAALTPLDANLALGALPPPALYSRSSLCSTPAGAPTCEALERGARLELSSERSLPSRPSMRWHGYLTSEVRVALYRVLP